MNVGHGVVASCWNEIPCTVAACTSYKIIRTVTRVTIKKKSLYFLFINLSIYLFTINTWQLLLMVRVTVLEMKTFAGVMIEMKSFAAKYNTFVQEKISHHESAGVSKNQNC